MYGLYTPVLIFQALCLYHAYRHNAEQRWYWFILLLPLIGGLLYIYHTFRNSSNIEAMNEGVKGIVNSNSAVEKFEQALEHSDNVTNRINLADAYIEIERFEEAIHLYKECLLGFMADDLPLRLKLLKAYYLNKNFEDAVALGSELEREKGFHMAEEKIAYAWAMHYTGQTESAKDVFQQMDKAHTNYTQRLEYCKFLQLTSDQPILSSKVNDLLEEFDTMQSIERKLHKPILKQLKELHYLIRNSSPNSSSQPA